MDTALVHHVTLAFESVKAEGLVKIYGLTRALGGVDLTLQQGEVTVIEGPNGAGKTTLMSILAMLTKPSSGTVSFGKLTQRRHAAEIRRNIGVLAHASMLYPDLTGRENLNVYRQLYGLAADSVSTVLKRFDAGSFVDRPTSTYSRGQIQRVSLARALLHAPTLLLLDEPTTGLDVGGVERVRDVVKAEKDRGAIQVVITHDKEFADAIADQRIHIVRGKRVAETSA